MPCLHTYSAGSSLLLHRTLTGALFLPGSAETPLSTPRQTAHQETPRPHRSWELGTMLHSKVAWRSTSQTKRAARKAGVSMHTLRLVAMDRVSLDGGTVSLKAAWVSLMRLSRLTSRAQISGGATGIRSWQGCLQESWWVDSDCHTIWHPHQSIFLLNASSSLLYCTLLEMYCGPSIPPCQISSVSVLLLFWHTISYLLCGFLPVALYIYVCLLHIYLFLWIHKNLHTYR